MNYEQVLNYESKKVFILLKNNFKYSGTIKKVNRDSIIFCDKYQREIVIDIDNISVLSDFCGGAL